MKTKSYLVNLDIETIRLIDLHCFQKNISRSEGIRWIIQSWIEQHQQHLVAMTKAHKKEVRELSRNILHSSPPQYGN